MERNDFTNESSWFPKINLLKFKNFNVNLHKPIPGREVKIWEEIEVFASVKSKKNKHIKYNNLKVNGGFQKPFQKLQRYKAT